MRISDPNVKKYIQDWHHGFLELPPSKPRMSLYLSIYEAKNIAKGKLALKVVAPPYYNEILLLDRYNPMFENFEAQNSKSEVGLFRKHGRHAVSGDNSEVWLKYDMLLSASKNYCQESLPPVVSQYIDEHEDFEDLPSSAFLTISEAREIEKGNKEMWVLHSAFDSKIFFYKNFYEFEKSRELGLDIFYTDSPAVTGKEMAIYGNSPCLKYDVIARFASERSRLALLPKEIRSVLRGLARAKDVRIDGNYKSISSIPASACVTLSEVRKIANGKLKLRVIPPGKYNTSFILDKKDWVFKNRSDDDEKTVGKFTSERGNDAAETVLGPWIKYAAVAALAKKTPKIHRLSRKIRAKKVI